MTYHRESNNRFISEPNVPTATQSSDSSESSHVLGKVDLAEDFSPNLKIHHKSRIIFNKLNQNDASGGEAITGSIQNTRNSTDGQILQIDYSNSNEDDHSLSTVLEDGDLLAIE